MQQKYREKLRAPVHQSSRVGEKKREGRKISYPVPRVRGARRVRPRIVETQQINNHDCIDPLIAECKANQEASLFFYKICIL